MSIYLDYPLSDKKTISVQKFNNLSSIQMHKHDFQEFVLITRGSCVHVYKNSNVILMPGDVFLIPPHQLHGYENMGDITIYNCQFYPEEIGGDCSDILKTVVNCHFEDTESQDLLGNRLNILKELPGEKSPSDDRNMETLKGDINKQGIIHLDNGTLNYIEEILMKMLEEQCDSKVGSDYLRKAYLEIILVIIKRVQLKQYEGLQKCYRPKEDLIYRAMEIIENDLSEEMDLKAYASEHGMSENYFRNIFRKVSGLSPKEYVNRLRIVKSLELFQIHDWSIAETAAYVGILDANYFSRLFKKIMGYSPRHFKKIQEE